LGKTDGFSRRTDGVSIPRRVTHKKRLLRYTRLWLRHNSNKWPYGGNKRGTYRSPIGVHGGGRGNWRSAVTCLAPGIPCCGCSRSDRRVRGCFSVLNAAECFLRPWSSWYIRMSLPLGTCRRLGLCRRSAVVLWIG